MVKSNTSIAKMPRPCLQNWDFVARSSKYRDITTVDTLIIPALANSLAKITGVFIMFHSYHRLTPSSGFSTLQKCSMVFLGAYQFLYLIWGFFCKSLQVQGIIWILNCDASRNLGAYLNFTLCLFSRSRTWK